VLDAASIIIQYHLFLAVALVIAGLAGILLRYLEKRKLLPALFSTPEYVIIAILVVVYVFANVS
jgi:hypothetical protein